jgi:hypothetical protein
VFCLANGHLREEQILERGDHMYLCAPRGQVVEGCLIISPYSCIGCLARMPASHYVELERMRSVVEAFYADVYGLTRATFYEQGRAGGGAVIDAKGGFPHHAHLACVPAAVDLHTLLAREHTTLDGPLSAVRSPYVYVDCSGRRAVYVPDSRTGWAALEQLRLKPAVARLIGLPERGDWRAHAGDRELRRVIERFKRYRTTGGVDWE